jgi:4-nitrophenyl phosphatase
MRSYGFYFTETNPDAVVMGMDRSITYDKLSKATVAVRSGAMFISTNEDVAVPTEQGFHPGNGALTSVVTTASQKKPIFIGKPQPIMVDMAMQALGLSKDEVALIGDNYDTDILAGVRAGIDTIHVNTGITSREAAAAKETPPAYQVETLAEWADYL